MTHQEAFEALQARRRDRLDPQAGVELAEHLAGCESCRALERTYDVLFAGLQEELAHPAADELALYVTASTSFSTQERRRIESHVAECRSCREELSRGRSVQASVDAESGPPRRRPRRRSSRLLLAAAAALAAAMMYPAYLGLFRLPEISREVSNLRSSVAELERARSWSGVATLQVLASVMREGEETPTVERDPSRPFVLLGAQVVVPGDVADETPIRLDISTNGGDVAITSTRLSASDVRAQVRSSGLVTWLVPTDLLPPGAYRLRVVCGDSTESAVLLEVAFVVPG